MEKIEMESYVMVLNSDSSLLKTNELIRSHGFEFIFCTWADLQEKNSSLFGFMSSNIISTEMNYIIQDQELSSTLFNSLKQYFGNGFHLHSGIVLLKNLNSGFLNKTGNSISFDESFGAWANELQEFANNILLQLRLLKSGPISLGPQFEINQETRHVYSKLEGQKTKINFNNHFSLTYEELEEFKIKYNPNFQTNNLCELAVENFELSYKLENPKTRFVTLMTALESLFNQGRDQITHIVSRHLALIVSNDRTEFQEHYKAIKKLYGVRSAIVHGQDLKKVNLGQECSTLEEYVRKALNYCLKLNINRKQLFEELNAKGF